MNETPQLAIVRGRAWVFGDGINTDLMAPGLYFKAPLEELARHCLEAVDAAFPVQVKPGDIVVAGENFGIGSAREQAPMALTQLGVGAVLAKSFGRIFYRNALNFGLPALRFPQAGEIAPGSELQLDPASGRLDDLASGRSYRLEPLPPHLLRLLAAGGLMPYLKQRLAEASQP